MIPTGNLASNTAEQHSVNKNIICVTGDDDSDRKPSVEYSRTAFSK